MRHLPGAAWHSTTVRLAWVGFAAAIVIAALYVFGTQHTPSYTLGLFGQRGSDAIRLKSQIATGVLGLALVQLLLALWLYGKLPGLQKGSRPVGRLHRGVGVALFLVTLPVAVHCMFAYGVQTYNARVTVHSLGGCFFYGAFVAKVLVVRSRHLPGWVLPVIGGLLVTAVAVIWYSSALWYFNGYRIPFT
jgi:Family of unknown function (DUF6529)